VRRHESTLATKAFKPYLNRYPSATKSISSPRNARRHHQLREGVEIIGFSLVLQSLDAYVPKSSSKTTRRSLLPRRSEQAVPNPSGGRRARPLC